MPGDGYNDLAGVLDKCHLGWRRPARVPRDTDGWVATMVWSRAQASGLAWVRLCAFLSTQYRTAHFSVSGLPCQVGVLHATNK